MHNSLRFFIILPSLLILTFCSEKQPIPEDTLILIYADLMFAQDTMLITTQNVDSLKSQVFSRFDVLEDDYLNTIEFYNMIPERWEKFFDRVIEYVESLKTKPVKQENSSFWPRLFVKVQN